MSSMYRSEIDLTFETKPKQNMSHIKVISQLSEKKRPVNINGKRVVLLGSYIRHSPPERFAGLTHEQNSIHQGPSALGARSLLAKAQ